MESLVIYLSVPGIIFPNLGIELAEIDKTAFSVFGFGVRWYGIMLGLGVIFGVMAGLWTAKRMGESVDFYMDFGFYAIIASILGARIYYVIFSWDSYKDNLLKIFDYRSGGLAIYGVILASILTAFIFTRVKKYPFLRLCDVGACAIPLGQAIGRWGNFVNKEAFGGYTSSFFSMLLKYDERTIGGGITRQMRENLVTKYGAEYISVHPTFLYESVWCLLIFVFLNIYIKRRKFEGEVFFFYLLLYGFGRFFIEGLRTDQLILFGTGIPVSQLLSAVLVILALGAIIYMRIKTKKNLRRYENGESI